MIVQAQSVLHVLWILCNSAVFNLYQLAIYVLIRPFNRALYRKVMGAQCQQAWVDVISCSFPESNIIATGDIPTDINKPMIILANHQVDADWWYLWQMARLQGAAGNVKITLKGELKQVPIIGWGMQFFEFLFLKRSIEHDRLHVQGIPSFICILELKRPAEEYMQSFLQDKFPFWMIIFPEGTTIHSEYVAKSRAFAAKTNRPTFEHLLLPRSTGLQIMMDAFSTDDVKPDIFDLTMAYPSYSGEVPTYAMGYGRNVDTEIPSMKSLVAGAGPSDVHIHSEKFSFDHVKQLGVERFLDRQWETKDKLLQEFIANQSFASKSASRCVIRPRSSVTAICRLWGAALASFFLLPLLLITVLPCYGLTVLYAAVMNSWDRRPTAFWPYLLNAVSERQSAWKLKRP
ncbi:1-acyl-sn-glycerol-3-phosphate acyltransferase [Achlya hypogyna]|uniref:1-acyl-sn-glycerol-3-phosphate acyltransferase n=1 Tax=Achlya hypogyna TaxID=1202772 RepID=A0A1V9ZJG6_ACHHY|nr:1-acyl-sn-glycerol-3-phosphate acyltransferase [Achlya hypogyna]